MSRVGRGGGVLAAAVVVAVGGYMMASLAGVAGVEDVEHAGDCPDLRGRTVVHEQGPDGTAYTLDNVLVDATTCTYRGAAYFGGPRGGESRGAYTFRRLRGGDGGLGSADDRPSAVENSAGP